MSDHESSTEREAKRQYGKARKEAEDDIELVEPTPDEARNGWTAESLTEYLRDQKAAQSMRMNPHSVMRRQPPRRANSKYQPLRWRG